MKHTYCDYENHATACTIHLGTVMGHKTYLLSSLEVTRERRGNGVASRLLQEVLADADAEGAQMILIVEPDGSIGSLDADALTSFYERYGFREYEFGHGMIRPPKADACLET